TARLQDARDLLADEARGVDEHVRDTRLVALGPVDRVEDLRERQVVGDLDARHGDEARAGIAELELDAVRGALLDAGLDAGLRAGVDHRSCPRTTSIRGLERALDLDDLVGLDHIAFADVVVVLERDPALEALAHLARVVLLTAQRRHRARVDHRRIAQEARLAGAEDAPVDDEAAGDVAELR